MLDSSPIFTQSLIEKPLITALALAPLPSLRLRLQCTQPRQTAIASLPLKQLW